MSEVTVLPQNSGVHQKQWRSKKLGLGVLLVINVLALFVWRPLTLLKLLFSVAVGGILLWLNIQVRRFEKKQKTELEKEKEQTAYEEEYEEITSRYKDEVGETRMITIEDNKGVLYNLQNFEPQYIYISDSRKIIG